MVLESDRVSGVHTVCAVVGAASRRLLSVRGFFFNTDTPLMMPLEIQLQTASPRGAVMIHAVGKLLIWKQRVKGVTKYRTKAEAVLVRPGWVLLSIWQIYPSSLQVPPAEEKKNREKTQTRLVLGLISNDERLPGWQKPDSTQIQCVDPICLPCSREEVVIRHLLSDPLTSRMDEAIMGASGGKSQLPASLHWSTMHLLYLHWWIGHHACPPCRE